MGAHFTVRNKQTRNQRTEAILASERGVKVKVDSPEDVTRTDLKLLYRAKESKAAWIQDGGQWECLESTEN